MKSSYLYNMRGLLFLFIIGGLLITSCSEKEDHQPQYNTSQLKINKWESLGSQTLIIIDLQNRLSKEKKVNLRIKAINDKGTVFLKDTSFTIHANQFKDQIQVLMNTRGTIKEVSLTSS